MTLGGCPIHWVSRLQTEMALSTLEAQCIALAQAMRDLVPMRRLLKEVLGAVAPHLQDDPTLLKSTVWEDNNGAISTAKSPKMTPRTKHIAVKYHCTRGQIGEEKGVVLEKIESKMQKADILTKGLPQEDFERIRFLLCGW